MKIFNLPDLGEGLAEAEIREWYVKIGDEVHVDQPLVSMETAKAVVDVPSPYAGKIVELHGKVNDIIQTGAPFITFETSDVPDTERLGKNPDKGSVVGKLETSEKKWDDGNVIIGASKPKSQTIKAMPAARVLAQQMKVDLSQVTPTGPQGLITPDDVKKVIDHKPQSTKLMGQTETLHGVRRAMALTMAQLHRAIVPVTIIEDADITDLPPDMDMTVQLLKAMVAAVKAEPALNAWFDGNALERKLFDEVHIGLAADTKEGLFVPVIKHVEQQSQEALRQIIDTYKNAVRTRSITPADMQGATITLSNFGMITGRYATPIIVPPTVAILGCGRSREVAIPRNGQIVIGRMVPLSLTFDHRVVTGGEATRFLGALIKYLQENN
jgi:2-oxoisovalerate dehydrogenase E2 component (dihydrolipoyl transacylase)